jgi:hypothetical protein
VVQGRHPILRGLHRHILAFVEAIEPVLAHEGLLTLLEASVGHDDPRTQRSSSQDEESTAVQRKHVPRVSVVLAAIATKQEPSSLVLDEQTQSNRKPNVTDGRDREVLSIALDSVS